MMKKNFGYWLCFRLKDDDEFVKLHGSIWRKQEPYFEERFKAATLVFDNRNDAITFQGRLVALMKRKNVQGKVWLKRFHFTHDVVEGTVGPAIADKKKPFSTVLVKAAKAGK